MFPQSITLISKWATLTFQGQERKFNHSAYSTNLNCVEHTTITGTSLRLRWCAMSAFLHKKTISNGRPNFLKARCAHRTRRSLGGERLILSSLTARTFEGAKVKKHLPDGTLEKSLGCSPNQSHSYQRELRPTFGRVGVNIPSFSL